MSSRSIIAVLTAASWSMMIESHFSQPAERPAHAARCASLISSTLDTDAVLPGGRAAFNYLDAYDDEPSPRNGHGGRRPSRRHRGRPVSALRVDAPRGADRVGSPDRASVAHDL